MDNTKVRVENVTKVFGKHPQRALSLLKEGKSKSEILKETGMNVGVKKATFEVFSGEIFVIMGLSGSGKSTLVRMLNQLIKPTAGHIYIDGEDIATMGKEELRRVRRTKMSMVFQKFALFPHRTVLQNVAYGLEIQGVPVEEREKKALESLKLVGLDHHKDNYPSQLSGGMQQRVGIARALTNDPDVLLMDESFSALDPLIRKEMQDELLELQDKMEKTIIFITHDLDEALRIGDRIALMKDGEIVQIGTPEEIMMSPANEFVEKFVADVNLGKVITAESILKRPETLLIDRGPRVALQIMRNAGVSTVYVVNKKYEFLGILTADDASKAVQKQWPIADLLLNDIPHVYLDTLLEETYAKMAEMKYPLPVIDEKKRLRGIIKRESVIQALAGNIEEEVKDDE
ncbi:MULTISPECIES: quaternary amine ABC transporter ATP-binding protein [Bacillus]|jgi:glycine betaine/proline transport system ATP-binding protein|uniref:Quaternary amine transport ATP-binding protein n=1 Tax=Bacillus toyonensis TaxID=155322 RepID=A0A1V6LDW1_9BACI|nr:MULTISPECIES: glycine betaine/L-proline ABC transporter ATP-binding protein [Bacillus]EEL34081.1 Glycine betaine transport ATP-binding protein opuAA [Bacillus cereus Rock3-28]EEL40029.1 Glycine betaine transport ATP-binding protein opuAA [Bacillus cereus Rock3-29]ARC27953.1 glycine betaine/L-proline ABC transporter ATP-binding protein [Bacillus sp. FDAARGOS_235]EJQ38979.1 glycine betaine/L-proline transport ATP binding subunit [Bacillus toyonensis]EJQ80613.1 glycine betaine/L-proline transp